MPIVLISLGFQFKFENSCCSKNNRRISSVLLLIRILLRTRRLCWSIRLGFFRYAIKWFWFLLVFSFLVEHLRARKRRRTLKRGLRKAIVDDYRRFKYRAFEYASSVPGFGFLSSKNWVSGFFGYGAIRLEFYSGRSGVFPNSLQQHWLSPASFYRMNKRLPPAEDAHIFARPRPQGFVCARSAEESISYDRLIILALETSKCQQIPLVDLLTMAATHCGYNRKEWVPNIRGGIGFCPWAFFLCI